MIKQGVFQQPVRLLIRNLKRGGAPHGKAFYKNSVWQPQQIKNIFFFAEESRSEGEDEKAQDKVWRENFKIM